MTWDPIIDNAVRVIEGEPLSFNNSQALSQLHANVQANQRGMLRVPGSTP